MMHYCRAIKGYSLDSAKRIPVLRKRLLYMLRYVGKGNCLTCKES